MPAGCPKPSCLGKNKFKIIDAWKRKSNNALYQWDYGFSALIELPGDAYDINGGSILLRFAQGNRQGSIQTWNFRYFGFYNNNNDVLFHTKVNTHTLLNMVQLNLTRYAFTVPLFWTAHDLIISLVLA